MIAILPWFVILALSGAYLFHGDFVSIGALIFGYVVGLFVYAQMILPLVYGAPKSLWLFYKKRVRFLAVLSHLLTSAIWFTGFIVLGFVLQVIAPSINQFLIFNQEFNLGGLLAITSLLLNFLTKQGRNDMSTDYEKTTLQRYGIAT